jgi:two-component system chemotaxis response regulator CheY
MQTRKILVVDDSKLIHKMFEVMLRPHTLVHAEDGREGLNRLVEHTDVDLILLDINMPRMNGLEFLSEIKKSDAFAEIPVVVVSTEGKDEDTERALAAGAAAYIKKPFQSESILRVVSDVTVSA